MSRVRKVQPELNMQGGSISLKEAYSLSVEEYEKVNAEWQKIDNEYGEVRKKRQSAWNRVVALRDAIEALTPSE